MEKSTFFTSVNGDRKYTAEDFAGFFKSFLSNGTFNVDTDLGVIASSTLELKLQPGIAYMEGYQYENTTELTLTAEVGDAVLPRYDRVVIRADYRERKIFATIKKGVAASTPQRPVLQRDAEAYEICVAEYKIEAGSVSISQSAIIDTRKDAVLCGQVKSVLSSFEIEDFLNKNTGGTINAKIETNDVVPATPLAKLGEDANRYAKIYAKEIDISNNPFIQASGGTMTGSLNTMSLLPVETNKYNLGQSWCRWGSLFVKDIDVSGVHPFFSKTGGEISGGLKINYSPTATNDYQAMFTSFDANGQGDSNTYIGLRNASGNTAHMFRGLGGFSVQNPISTFEELRASKLRIGGKYLTISATAPTTPAEGDIWIQI